MLDHAPCRRPGYCPGTGGAYVIYGVSPRRGEIVHEANRSHRRSRCPAGSASENECVTTPAECDAVITCNDACDPCPDDSEVWGCRFSTSFAADSCADFPMINGFTSEQDAMAAASGTGGATNTPVCTFGYSCRYERALVSDITRCTYTDSGRDFYAYGVPSIGCSFGGGKDFISSGPICSEY